MDVLCEKDECEKEATTRYVWPWGDEGFLCDDHRGHTEQLALQLGRVVSFTPLAPPAAPAPAASHPELELAKRLLLEKDAELEETKGHRDRLIEQNAQLVQDLGKARRNVRAAQVDSDVEATASTNPTESPREKPSQPTGPRR